MQSKRIKYYLLGLFLAGLVLFIVLQFNADRNIRRLITGNEQLLQELSVKNELQRLQTNMARTDSKVRGAVISQDTLHITGIEADIAVIRADLNTIGKMMPDNSTDKLLTQLGYLIDEKNSFNLQVLDTFYGKGRHEAERMLNLQKGKRLTEAINAVLHQLDSTRQTAVNNTVRLIDASEQKAQRGNIILAGFACLASLLAFLYIISRIHRQEQLIAALDESEQKARRLAAVKDQFLANMSHEIRTPMNAVLGFACLLEGQPLNGQAQNYVAAIRSAGENLLDIINDILDISKIESGMMRLEPVSFSLREMLHSLQTMFLPKAAEKQLALNVHIAEHVPDLLYGDLMRLTQVLVNLVNNAIKFTDAGSVTVQVDRRGAGNNPVRLLFTVTDTGIGITPEQLPFIFDRFSQAETGTARKFGGAGLGLAIVKQLVELQHGSISVDSRPGKGSTFTVELPYQPGERISQPAAHPAPASHNGHQHTHIQLLVAEDNRLNQDLLRHLLHGWHFRFQVANNGKEALHALQQQHFDLVLMDIQMPEMDGYTAAQKIRQELHSTVPIIAMTAHAMPGEREKCLRYGMNEYIAKPLQEAELYRLIQVFTGKGGHTEPAATGAAQPPAPQTAAPINLQYLQQLSKGNTAFERTMLQQFISQLPEDLQVLREAIASADIPGIRAAAHNTKTTVSFIGLEQALYPLLDPLEALTPEQYNAAETTGRYARLRQVSLEAMQQAMELIMQAQ